MVFAMAMARSFWPTRYRALPYVAKKLVSVVVFESSSRYANCSFIWSNVMLPACA